MAINLPSDLVIEVARAVDPDTYRMAAERLHAVADVTAEVAPPARDFSKFFVATSTANSGALKRDTINPAYRKFEAFMLQSFVQSMFGSGSEAPFGRGVAGEYWKSMMAEAIANKMADVGGVGIAEMLEKQATVRVSPKPSLANGSAGRCEPPSLDAAVSRNLVHEMERRLIHQQLRGDSADASPDRAMT